MFRNHPFLRLLIPLAVGIWVGDYVFFRGIQIPVGILVSVVVTVFILLLIANGIRQYAMRWLFGVVLLVFLFLLGTTLITYKLSAGSYAFATKETVYRAVVTGKPEYKANSILCPSTLTGVYDSLHCTVHKKVLLYFPQDSLAAAIERGDELLFYGGVSLPGMNGNPEEFDYPRYLVRKGICGTAYVRQGKWKVVARSEHITLQEKAFNYRDHVLHIYKQLGFTGDELAVLSALTVGYKDELSEEIRESFSISGASHVLALSGLHVGILFGLMSFVFMRCFGTGRRASILRVVITVTLLWCFALLTGLSPSVVRSVCMFSLLGLSQIFTNKILTIHSLAVSAFFMLLINPVWMFDVGFQLSYIAVAGIILIQPRLFRLIKLRHGILRYFWGIVTVSVAAQMATAPLVLFYFSRFSTHFLLTNIWVVLLVTLIVYVAVIMLILLPLTWLSQCLADFLNVLLRTLNQSVRWFEQLPYSSIDNIWIHHWDVFVFYLALLFGIGLTIRFTPKYIYAFLLCCLFMVSHQLWIVVKEPPRSNIAFYNIRNCPVVHCIEKDGNSWLVYADSIPQSKWLYKALSNYWNRRGLAAPQCVITNRKEKGFKRMDDYLIFGDKRIYILKDNNWKNKFSAAPLHIDYLYINKGFSGNIESLSGLFAAKCIVLDSSLSSYRTESLKLECELLGYEYVLLNDGALIVDL